MEIPGNDFRIKSKAIQDRVKAGDKITSAKSPGGVASSNSSEQVAISSKAKDIQQATKLVNATPDIRIEKVDQIKEQITNGSYHISSDQLAEKVLQNIITESEFLG
jgi:negative regulator of flagellin synthesis FlgM